MRRALRITGLALLGLVGVVVLWALVLAATNPRGRDAPAWARGADLPSARGEVASTVVELAGGPAVVIAGGFRPPIGSTSADVMVYDPGADSWAALPDLPGGRHHAALATLDGTLHLTGGAASGLDWTPRTNHWVLRPGAGAWEEAAPLPEGRSGHRMEAVDGRLYVIGGDGPSARVLIYDPDADEWSAGAAMPVQRDHLGSVVVDGRIWAIGGRAGGTEMQSRVDVYDPVDDRWETGPRLPIVLSAAVTGVVDGMVHVVGGEDPRVVRGGVIGRHLAYDPDEGWWLDCSLPFFDVHGAGGGAVDGELVVVGGSRRQGALSVLAWTGATQRYDTAAVDRTGDCRLTDEPLDD